MAWIAECECGAVTCLVLKKVRAQMERWTFEADCPACGLTATYYYTAKRVEV